jgi:hypothetical protein
MATTETLVDFELTATTGLVAGLTIQFAEVSSADEIGAGVAMSEEAFDLVEPHLYAVWPKWNINSRYGVSKIPVAVRILLMDALRAGISHVEATSPTADKQARLLGGLADWLASRLSEHQAIRILGL